MAERDIIWLSKGKPKTLTYKGIEYRSGISKSQADQLEVTYERIIDDDVENHDYHGGKERALCIYPYEHYTVWENLYHQPLPKAAFGENLTVIGMKEEDICVGDIFKIGTAVVQVSQGRFPCATINKHTHINTLLSKIIEYGYTGYFFRVIEEGTINRDSTITQIEQHPKQISIADIHHTFFHDKNPELIEEILSVNELSLEWKIRLEKLYQQLKKYRHF
ncbi:MOSC domain-containing protein [Metabacillus malikii]|uniref:MOSC domain-containing protein YiiM n=1 Tax=Metabacillus malikii TaxID=1504265 RepID=A0ABT9ZB07_9BACI|nr:MOSC domain-containing protein [Metabacillus malikii]MDQ0229441.1 MOSC domain-containing protein YiiM [Metabacillus malikii]